MGAVCGRCFGGGTASHDHGAAKGGRARRRHGRHRGSASHAEVVVPEAGRPACSIEREAAAGSPRGGAALKHAAPAHALASGYDGGGGGGGGSSARVASPRPLAPLSPTGACLVRTESGVDVFYDAEEVLDDPSALAEAPYAFARHALCGEPPAAGHAGCARGDATATTAVGGADGAADAEPGKAAEVLELEELGAQFGDDFWAGQGSLAGRGMKALQALRHLKDVDLSRFGGVPISQHMRVSGSQMLHVNSFMAGRAPPAARLDAHLRRELPAAAHADPLERFLCVLKAHMALLDAPAQSLRKPFNPVLGETSRILHFVEPGSPPVAAVCEQVSHHPPVTAFASWDASLGWLYSGWVDIAPRFSGLSIRVPMTGQRELALAPEGPGAAPERYRATIPAMQWSFIPAVRAEYTGTWRLWCDETGLCAEVTHLTKNMLGFGKPNRVEGRVWRAPPGAAALITLDAAASPRRRRSADAELLFTFDGCFDDVVWLRPAGATSTRGGGARQRATAPRMLWDATSAAALESAAPPPRPQPELEQRPADVVWGPVFRAMDEGAWDVARAEKEAVEMAERAARKERAARGERWEPTWFVHDAISGGWAPRA